MDCKIWFTVGKSELNPVENIDSKILYGEGEELSPKELFLNIVKVLKKSKIDEDNAYTKLVQVINNDLENNLVDFSILKLDDFEGITSAVQNANMEYVRDLYPDIEFPSGVDTRIIILDLLEPGSKKPIVGRVLGEDGKEILIVKNNRLSMLRLSKFLKLKQAILDPEFMNKLPDYLIDELKEVAEEFKMPSILDVALQFDIDLTSFFNSKFKTKSGRTPFIILNELQIYASGHTPTKYNSKTLEELKRRVKYFAKGAYLDMDSFFDTILSLGDWGKVMKALNIESGEGLLNFFNRNSNDVTDALNKANLKNLLNDILDEDVIYFINNIQTNSNNEFTHPVLSFFKTLSDLKQIHEPLFNYQVVELGKKNGHNAVTFSEIYPTLELSGVGFETRKNFIEVSRKGSYRVYLRTEEDGTKYYYLSNHIIGRGANSRTYLTLDEAEKVAEENNNKMTLDDASLATLKKNFSGDDLSGEARTFELNYLIPEDTIVETLPYSINKVGMMAKEYMLFSKNLKAFQDYIYEIFDLAVVLRDNVLKYIDSPEKAAVFLSELNKPLRNFNRVNKETQEVTYDRTNYLAMEELALEIASKTPKYYYIRATRKVNKTSILSELSQLELKKKFSGRINYSFRHYYIPIEDNKPEEVRQNPRIPIVKSIESIATVLRDKFEIPVNVINGTYINDELNSPDGKFYGKDINLNAKAFIVDGEIYVNTDAASVTDMFHEYTHLFLGVLKAYDFKAYQEMLDTLSEYLEFLLALNNKQSLYPNRSYYDLLEEVFADLYGEWIENNLKGDLNKVFEYIASKDEMKAALYTVFDKTADGSGKGIQYLFGGKYLTTVWERFNTNVSKMLSDKENLSFMKGTDLKLLRQLSNWIEKLIRIYKELKKANPEKKDTELEGIKEVCV